MVAIVTVSGFVVPAILYLWFIHHFGVNVIWGDQWSDVNIIARFRAGTLNLATLWAAHNENRIFFPNLVVLVIGRLTRLNLFVEMYLGAVLLMGAVGLLTIAHKRRSPDLPWLYYCPVAILMLSLVQYQNTLWGFQFALYLVMAMLAVAIFLLDRPSLTAPAFAGALTVAVIGSYSSLQGLMIWPAGLVLLYHRRRSISAVTTWIVIGLATAFFYFYRLPPGRFGSGTSRGLFADPIALVKIFVFAVGDIVGQPVSAAHGASGTVVAAVLGVGTVVTVCAIWVIVRYGFRRDETTGAPIGIALICFGLLFAGVVTIGRARFELWSASQSRYTTFDILVLVGAYLALLGPAIATLRARRRHLSSQLVIGGIVIAAMFVQVVLGLGNGLGGGRTTEDGRLFSGPILMHIQVVPDSYVSEYLYPFGPVSLVRHMAPVARRLGLSSYPTEPASADRGLVVGFLADQAGAPVQPWQGIRPGGVVVVRGSVSGSTTRMVSVTVCNPRVLSRDSAACDTSAVVAATTRADGAFTTSVVVPPGPVGDGRCDAGQVCFVEVTAVPSGASSFAEITLR